MEQVKSRINEAKDTLAGDNEREYDVFVKGMIRAFDEVLEVDISQEENV